LKREEVRLMGAVPSLLSEPDAALLSDYLEFSHLISLVNYPALSWREYLTDVQEEALEKDGSDTDELMSGDRRSAWTIW
jgi:hypothetical protein